MESDTLVSGDPWESTHSAIGSDWFSGHDTDRQLISLTFTWPLARNEDDGQDRGVGN